MMVAVPGGAFLMGSPDTDTDAYEDEKPQRHVTVSDFCISRYPITRWFCGDDPAVLGRYAWFADNSGYTVHPVGEKAPNPWDLHDMMGNVWEWCWDWYETYRAATVSNPTGPEDARYRALRGGSAWHVPRYLRSAVRVRDLPELRSDVIGFRWVRRPRRQL